MKQLCAAILLSSVAALTGCSVKPRAVMLAAGDYLRSDYVDCLKQTRSPLRCEVSGEPQLIEVRRGTGGADLVVASFHEGFAGLVQHRDGSIESSHDSALQNLTVDALDAHHVRVGARGLKSFVYVFVGSLDRYVAQETLVGTYVDDKGRNYVFGNDGWASFPERRFEYVVAADHVLNAYDYFYEKSGGPVFVFERHGSELEIFRTTGESDEVVDKRPSYSLRELSSVR